MFKPTFEPLNPPGLTTHLHVKVGRVGVRVCVAEGTHSPTNPTWWILTGLPNFKILSQAVWKIKNFVSLNFLQTFAVSTQAAARSVSKAESALTFGRNQLFESPKSKLFCIGTNL